MAPALLVVIGWRLLYVQAGFGAAATSIYHDPSTDLLDFIQAQVTHLPVLMLGRWLPAPLDFWSITPAAGQWAAVGLGVALTAGLGLLLRPLLRTDPRARFLALGMLGALLPFCATVPMDRLTLFAGVGFAGLLGLLAQATLASRWARRARTAVLVLHLPLAALFGAGRAGTLALNFQPNTAGLAQAPADPAVLKQTFVYVTTTFHRVHYTTLMRAAAGQPAPRRVAPLGSIATNSAVTRLDVHTLQIEPEGGFMALGLDRIHRRVTARFTVGQTVELPDLTVRVTALTADGRPARATFRFRRPLDDPRYRWLAVVPGPGLAPFDFQTRPFRLPPVGRTVHLKGL